TSACTSRAPTTPAWCSSSCPRRAGWPSSTPSKRWSSWTAGDCACGSLRASARGSSGCSFASGPTPGWSRVTAPPRPRPPVDCWRAMAGSLRIPVDENLPPAPPASGRRVPGSLRSAIEWTLIVVGALVVALIVKATVLQAFYIPSESMKPTLEVGDRVLVNKLSYHVHAVRRGDV